MTRSRQTLDESHRKAIADWAADCADEVLFMFEISRPDDQRPRAAIAQARSFARGEMTAAEGIRIRYGGGGLIGKSVSAAAVSAGRAAGQASAVCHMGAHGLGAAAYAIEAVQLFRPHDKQAAADEMQRKLSSMPETVRAALLLLPTIGTERSGPLGPGLLSSGNIGRIILRLQAEL